MSDLISRQAAIDVIEKTIKANESIHYEMKYWKEGMTCAKEIVEDLPSAERHGKWIDPEDLTCYKCSVCGEYATQEYGLTEPIFWHYCPNCGAKMDEVEE